MVSRDKITCCKTILDEASKKAGKVTGRFECLQGILKDSIYLKNYVILRSISESGNIRIHTHDLLHLNSSF